MARSNANPGKAEGAVLRRQQALQLRLAGVSYRKIAAQLGISHGQAEQDVARELLPTATANKADADTLRALETARLDAALLIIAKQIQAGDLKAIDRLLRIGERRAKLLGLDAVERQEQSGKLEIVITYADADPHTAPAP